MAKANTLSEQTHGAIVELDRLGWRKVWAENCGPKFSTVLMARGPNDTDSEGRSGIILDFGVGHGCQWFSAGAFPDEVKS